MDDFLTADPSRFAALCAERLARARADVAAFKALPPGTPFLETARAWDRIGSDLNGVTGLTHLFFQVHPDEAMREVAADLEQEFSRFSTETSLDRELYDRLAALDPAAAPDPAAGRLVEHALRDFRRAGVDRSEDERVRVRALREELVQLSQSFSRHIAGDVRRIVLDGPAELEGLPADFIASHPPDAEGRVTVTTNPPDQVPFMKFARRRAHRAALLRASHQRGAPGNFEVLDGLLAKRHDLARRLGYENWAAYITEDKMIRSPERAADFIRRVTELTAERMQAELDEMLAALRAEEPDADTIRHHDVNYLIESIRRSRFDYDSRQVREYLPYEAVRQGVLDVAARLYGLSFERRADVPVWHPDVEVYDVLENGRPMARFFLDMHPRPDKFKHAAMFNLETGLLGEVLPSACLVCNMARPSGDDPALLDPGDVRTYFHEFGHLLHHLLAGRQAWLGLSGIATEWDFVEVPSQLFEEWTRSPDILRSFARHHRTGQPIPADLVERMNRASDYGKAVSARVQMFYAALSLEYFRRDPAGLDTTAVMRALKPDYLPFPHEEGTHFQTSFGHLDGYSALYYTYMWSLVLAKDCLSVFGDDLMDDAVARRYRDTVLAPGGSRDAEDLLADFLGRPFRFDAFEAWLAA